MNQDIGAKCIDLNFGCPAKKVLGGYSGSALKSHKVLQDCLDDCVQNWYTCVVLWFWAYWNYT